MMNIKHHHTFTKKLHEKYRRNSLKYHKKEPNLRMIASPDQKMRVNEINWRGERDRGMDLGSKAYVFLWLILPLVVFPRSSPSPPIPIRSSSISSTSLLARKTKKHKDPRNSKKISATSPPLIKRPKRFQLQKWNAVAFWALDLLLDNCPICRNEIMELCIECQCQAHLDGATTEEECPAVRGVCGHVFHAHCIRDWLEIKNVCPLDHLKWELQS